VDRGAKQAPGRRQPGARGVVVRAHLTAEHDDRGEAVRIDRNVVIGETQPDVDGNIRRGEPVAEPSQRAGLVVLNHEQRTGFTHAEHPSQTWRTVGCAGPRSVDILALVKVRPYAAPFHAPPRRSPDAG
jgi:hypothetical protein